MSIQSLQDVSRVRSGFGASPWAASELPLSILTYQGAASSKRHWIVTGCPFKASVCAERAIMSKSRRWTSGEESGLGTGSPAAPARMSVIARRALSSCGSERSNGYTSDGISWIGKPAAFHFASTERIPNA